MHLHFILRVAFAVGVLLGDTVLHLLPTAYGLHAHDEAAESESEHAELGVDTHLLAIGLVFLLGIFFFFALERHIEHMHGPEDHHEHHHHNHAPAAPVAAADDEKADVIGEKVRKLYSSYKA